MDSITKQLEKKIKEFINSLKKGKYPREKFWMDIFASFIMAGMFKFLLDIFISSNITRAAYIVLYLYWMVIEIRRFHDANRPGWWTTLNLVPGVGTLTALLLSGVMASDYEDNPWCE